MLRRKSASSLPTASRLYDPAKDAARLLGWFGLTVLMIAAPVVGVLSRRALLVLLPVGIAILAAGYLLSASRAGLTTLRRSFATPIGGCGLFLGGWATLSLAWTPFPELAIPRLVATCATVLAAAVIIAHIPERRARPYLYLLPAGVAVTAVATLGLALLGPAAFRGGTEFDPSLLERSVLTLTVLLWPAVGALAAFSRWRIAGGLAALVAATLAAADARIAMAVLAMGALAFAAAAGDPRRVGRVLGILFAGLAFSAPLLPYGLAPLARSLPPVGASTVAAMTDWRSLVADDLPRLLTGHGINEARIGVETGFLPSHTPRTVLFEVWYDLGLLGAVALAALLALGLRAAGEAAPQVAPALLGGLVATVAIAVFGVATAELWFVTLVSLQAIAFGLLARSSRHGRPPSAAPGNTPDASLADAYLRV